MRNLISGGYEGTLRVVNPKEDAVQGIKAFHDVKELPPTDLAILVVAAKYCPDYVKFLASEKNPADEDSYACWLSTVPVPDGVSRVCDYFRVMVDFNSDF